MSFPSSLVRHLVLLTELLEQTRPTATQGCLQASWCVVDASMNDTAVVTCLVACDSGLFFEDRYRYPGYRETHFCVTASPTTSPPTIPTRPQPLCGHPLNHPPSTSDNLASDVIRCI